MKTKPIRGWVIVNPNGYVQKATFSTAKKWTISCRYEQQPWRELYRDGYRCKRAVLALEEDSRHGGIRELVETVQLRVPAPTLADDLRALVASMEAPPHDNATAFYTERLRDILRKHGEAE